MSNSFGLAVAPVNYRARPRVTLAPRLMSETAGNPFAVRRLTFRALVAACVFAAGAVAGQLVTLHTLGVL